MHLYRQSIILFGAVLPVLCATAVGGVGYLLKSKMAASFENKQRTYKTYEQGRIAGPRNRNPGDPPTRCTSNAGTNNSREETASAVATNLREISEKLPGKEIQQTAFERPNTSGGFGAASAQNSSQIRIAFRGTFRTLQRAFLELETRMPQLQLQEFKMDPIATHASLMNFQVTYTAWEN